MLQIICKCLLLIMCMESSHGSENSLSLTQQHHYWNLFKLKDVFLRCSIAQDTNGILLRAASFNNTRKLEFSYQHPYLTIQLPEKNDWHRRITVNLDEEDSHDNNEIDFLVVINDNIIMVFDGCTQVFSDLIENVDFRFDVEKLELIPEWNGKHPLNVELNSGFPINHKCENVTRIERENHNVRIEKSGNVVRKNLKPSRSQTTFILLPPLNFQGCRVDNELITVGATVYHNCSMCTCVERDNVVCQAEDCPHVTCKSPVIREGECCPTCGRQCYNNETRSTHAHDEVFWPYDCYRCHCFDGSINCQKKKIECSKPQCPESDWVTASSHECCSKCRDYADYCSTNPCQANSDCFNERRGAKCVCKEGFLWNGTECADIDECNFADDVKIQLGGCSQGTHCVNTPGSFRCDCLAGHQRITDTLCIPLLRV